MPRLLSKVSPNKSVDDFNIEECKQTSAEKKTIDEMSSWEYYFFLGKRKMGRYEWWIWKGKKDKEDWKKKYDEEGRRKISSTEFGWRIKKDPDFDERLYVIDHKLK